MRFSLHLLIKRLGAGAGQDVSKLKVQLQEANAAKMIAEDVNHALQVTEMC